MEITQKELQRDFLKIMLIREDIERVGAMFDDSCEKHDLKEMLRILKDTFVPYSIMYDSMPVLNKYCVDNDDLSNCRKALLPRLEFMKYVRNKCSGHLDSDVLDNAIQWEPSLFCEIMKGDGTIILGLKSLLESVFNSYLDNQRVQKVFHTEIDLFYPPDWSLLMDFMHDIYKDSFAFLSDVLDYIEPQIVYSKTDVELLQKAMQAGRTDFKLIKPKRR